MADHSTTLGSRFQALYDDEYADSPKDNSPFIFTTVIARTSKIRSRRIGTGEWSTFDGAQFTQQAPKTTTAIANATVQKVTIPQVPRTNATVQKVTNPQVLRN